MLACSRGAEPEPPAASPSAFARDSMPVDSLTGWPSDSAREQLLDRIGIPHDTNGAVADSGCVLRTTDAALPQVQRVTCYMRDKSEAVDIEVQLREGELARLRIFG